jgi:hypothetical protein
VDPLKPPDQLELGGIVLRGCLGRGAMGTVYYGIAPDGEQVAVKMIREDLPDSSEVLGRFDREAIAIGMVQGPRAANLVATSAPGETPPWFAGVPRALRAMKLQRTCGRTGKPFRPRSDFAGWLTRQSACALAPASHDALELPH